MRTNILVGLGILVLGAGIVVSMAPHSTEQASPARLAMGATLYADNCASCHGANLEGEADWRTRNDDGTLRAPPHDRTGHTWHHSDEHLFTYTKLGGQEAMADIPQFVSGMPGFGETLSDDEIRSILDFIKSTWPEEIRTAQSQMSH